MQPASPSFPKVQALRLRSLSSQQLASTAGHSRFLRLALSERRKGGEIGGLDQSDSAARHSSEAWQPWQQES